MSWDAFQREVLDALGHTLYRLADAEPSPAPPLETVAQTAALTPLQRAVLRAACREATDDALQPLLAAARNLRGDAAGKRALWPRLRALRQDALRQDRRP
ncbi:hypothetical protein IP90_02047 [Luteimonas cucumeris]|uniref:Uncharacterized protein n=1 Tax=Luteimonas cucumeris TaxID=985012 RepID=A0A562L5R8_9GAMM|nr:hypothetical protein [Luteimonas cucumeris]TWI02945.1 hypothetical protein IP90_02047 [Luteimonas cucumeris]